MPVPIAACSGSKANTAVQAGGAPAEPSAIVSGAGTASANGTYTERGTSGGKPYYNLEGESDSVNTKAIVWSVGDGAWIIYGPADDALYLNQGEVVAFPWMSAAWDTIGGDDPPPTVTQS